MSSHLDKEWAKAEIARELLQSIKYAILRKTSKKKRLSTELQTINFLKFSIT
jgi:hypothetical protein